MNITKSLLAVFLIIVSMDVVRGAELFIKTDKQGYYSVTVSDQTLITSSNMFRFFDLAAGNYSITISDIYTETQVFNGTVSLNNNLRKVLELNNAWQIHQVAEFPVSYQNWYTESGTSLSASAINATPEPPVNTTVTNTNSLSNVKDVNDSIVLPPAAMNENEFVEMKKQLKNESFERDRSELAKSITRKNYLNSAQIAELCKLFSFDNYRLEYAKFAYDYCVDKNSYYKVSSTFTFSSYARDLEKYIEENK